MGNSEKNPQTFHSDWYIILEANERLNQPGSERELS